MRQSAVALVNGEWRFRYAERNKSGSGSTGPCLRPPRLSARAGRGRQRQRGARERPPHSHDGLIAEADHTTSRQPFKGLGKMHPEQLRETTMNPNVRRLLKMQIDNAIEAVWVFTMLIGD